MGSSPSVLGIELACVLELDDDERSFLLKAGVGFRDGLVRNLTVLRRLGGLAGGLHDARRRSRWSSTDVADERRFAAGDLLREHGVVSGLTVIVQGRGQAVRRARRL